MLWCAVGAATGEVVDLAELKLPAVELAVRQRAPIFATRDGGGARAHLPAGQRVTLLRWSPTRYFVDARAATGPVRGWVAAESVAELPAELAKQLRQRVAAQAEHRELIARQEVAVGMTRAEVIASLGQPDRREADAWRYFTHRYQPHLVQTQDAAGKLRQTVTYRRVPSGQRTVRFHGELVAAVDEEDTGRKP